MSQVDIFKSGTGVDPGFDFNIADNDQLGFIPVHKFCRSDTINTAISDIRPTGGIINWLQNPTLIEGVSSSAQDTLSGVGARRIVVEGLDESFSLIQEVISMSGILPSPSSKLFIRVNRMFVLQSGEYGSTLAGRNKGTITVRPLGGSAPLATIQVSSGTGMGESESSQFTVPRGYKGFVQNFFINIETQKLVNLMIWQRQRANNTNSDIAAPRLIARFTGLTGDNYLTLKTPKAFPEITDLWISGVTDTGTARAEIDYEITLKQVKK